MTEEACIDPESRDTQGAGLPKDNSNESMYLRYKELINIAVAFLLTAVAGSYITHRYQMRAHVEQRRAEALRQERQIAVEMLTEMSETLNARHFSAYLLIDRLEAYYKNKTPENWARVEESSKKYTETVYNWNIRWHLNRTMLLRTFGETAAGMLYQPIYEKPGPDEEQLALLDNLNGADLSTLRIIDKILALHRHLVKIKNLIRGDEQLEFRIAYDLYYHLDYDIYRLYNQMIGQIQSGRLGQLIDHEG